MLRPSYAELIELLNSEMAADSKITSRYTIVIAAAKRARQLVEGAVPLTYAPTDKSVSIAVNEMYNKKLHVLFPSEKDAPSITYPSSYEVGFGDMMEEHED